MGASCVCVCACVTPKSIKSCSNCKFQQLSPTAMRPNHEFMNAGAPSAGSGTGLRHWQTCKQEGVVSVLLPHPASHLRAFVLPCVEAPLRVHCAGGGRGGSAHRIRWSSCAVCVCVCVCARVRTLGCVCCIKEGKGRLKSWTLCDGLSEGVMGQGLAAPAPPAPRPPLVSRRDGRTGRLGSGVCPLRPPMAPSRAFRAPCGCQRGTRALRGPLPIVAVTPPPLGGGGGRAHTVPPSRLACAIAHFPPLAPIEGAWSSGTAPHGAPCMTCTRGLCARRTGCA